MSAIQRLYVHASMHGFPAVIASEQWFVPPPLQPVQTLPPLPLELPLLEPLLLPLELPLLEPLLLPLLLPLELPLLDPLLLPLSVSRT
jgi:hypothetical protein